MKLADPAAPPPAANRQVDSYAQQLAALEAERRTRDLVLFRKMLQLREPMNPS
jgi:hypothetical protein